MSTASNNDTLSALSLRLPLQTTHQLPVSQLKIEKIQSLDIFKAKGLDLSSLRPAVKLGEFVHYKPLPFHGKL